MAAAKLGTLFGQFADEADAETSSVNGGGLLKLMAAVDLDMEDIRMTMLMWKLGARKTPGGIEKAEFVTGMQKLGLSTIAGLKGITPQLQTGFLENKEFFDLFRFVFKFNLEHLRKKTIDKESVIYLLEMCLDSDRAKHLKYFIAFLKTSKKVELNHDEWSSFFNFSVHIDLDCGNYEDDGAWPSLLDEYVEWKKEQA
jgi:hypothetical protein